MTSYYPSEGNDQMYYKYIHISSRHIDFASTKSDFQVNLIQPLRNVHAVALKSFSMPNTQYNIGLGQKLRWFESYDDGTDVHYKGFEIELDSAYYNATELKDHIKTKVLAIADHTFGLGDTTPQLVFNYDTTSFKFEITYTPAGAEVKTFAIFFDIDDHIWHSMGFDINQGIQHTYNRDFHILWTNQVIDAIPQHDSTVSPFASGTINALHVATIDNMKGLFINCPDLSISSSYETHIRHSTNQAQQSTILEWIPNNVERVTYLHYEPAHLSWHKIDNTDSTLNQFKIEILNYHGKKISQYEIQDFQLQLIVECKEHNEKSLETRERQYASAYSKAHPTTRLN